MTHKFLVLWVPANDLLAKDSRSAWPLFCELLESRRYSVRPVVLWINSPWSNSTDALAGSTILLTGLSASGRNATNAGSRLFGSSRFGAGCIAVRCGCNAGEE